MSVGAQAEDTVPGPVRLAGRGIDPLAPCPPGQYADHLVGVVREDPGVPDIVPPVVRTEHFSLRRRGRRVEVSHRLPPRRLDNDLAGLLADELFAPGWLSGPDIFERVFTGVVRSCVDGALPAWATFYGNTLARIHACWRVPAPGREHSSIAGFAPVYRRALRLVPPGSVLDLGSCFGFLALLLAERPLHRVTASDLSAGSMRLLEAVARMRRARLDTLVCDAARIPLPDGSVDTVTAIHLLEHLDEPHGDAVLREAVRVARRRVVVAVPFEDEPTTAYGHVRRFDRAALTRLGRRTGRRFAVTEHHGGWLVVNAG
ncbi:mycofactocin oligosaccharide methyltransferase MftM [Gandjariella thermophila]|uniref:SAM-dependent methyltransferase n=1 Tax=Gandjariella thermophila TaxID=1931992 RepID=A0A4D4J528_9PSEU|nr:mycofactocin oligosaccharide methyltransferase MftM [Gandjariella thermophila]GDY31631.1 SAM-dependent methyltransferase [Gandjariella thermophila]